VGGGWRGVEVEVEAEVVRLGGGVGGGNHFIAC